MEYFTGFEYCKIDIANQAGKDKLTWHERIQWVDDNEDCLDTLVDDADNRFLYIKALNTYERAKEGIATGAIMGLDATASGIAIMACLMGCETTARNTNLVYTGRREDLYQKIATTMSGLGTPVTRTDMKPPTMTVMYGSKREPKNVFGENTPALADFYETLEIEVPGALECLNDMQAFWKPQNLKHQWTLPDGHVASVKVMQAVDKKIEVDEYHHIVFTHRAKVNQPADFGLSNAANITHSRHKWSEYQ